MTQDNGREIPIIPGRGLVTAKSTKLRLEYLRANSIANGQISRTDLDILTIQKNIESYIGTVEIPVGIVGPLLFNDGDEPGELVYTAAGTLEGALVASMNRGAKAVSQSGGFTANVLWQKMTRAPLFIFEREQDVPVFERFVRSHFPEIKEKAESYSNHARLLDLECVGFDNVVHVKFIYNTGDASGQNMTTVCTWHAMIYIVDEFTRRTGIVPTDWILEGNGSSDKKVSAYSTTNGRGVNVTAECSLSESVLNRVLRTSSSKMLQAFEPSRKLAELDGMFGYNINVANAIAAIYVATGQDLACIHESSVGELNLRPVDDGLHISLNLPNLVIGTVGGGTRLAKQSEALQILGCQGNRKVERFAKLIAGFAMSLEVSTYAAIVSGEFAKAHEKLGRNKPTDWLVRSELSADFLAGCLNNFEHDLVAVGIKKNESPEDGILTQIATGVSRKLIGFETLGLSYRNGNGEVVEDTVLLKSKPLDREVIKGLHMVAASIDPALSDLIKEHQRDLEYWRCHLKEGEAYRFLSKQGARNIPRFYGEFKDENREIFIFVIEYLDQERLLLFNSENTPEMWSPDCVRSAIEAADGFHRHFRESGSQDEIGHVSLEFKAWKANPLYNKFISILIAEETHAAKNAELEELLDASLFLEELGKTLAVPKTVIHNDFNPRNVAVRRDGEVVVFDWELAVLDYPHRDIVEFLSFVLPEDFADEELFGYFEFHYGLNAAEFASKTDWYRAYEYAVIEFIVSRAVFYEVAGISVKYDFSRRILDNALRILRILRQHNGCPAEGRTDRAIARESSNG